MRQREAVASSIVAFLACLGGCNASLSNEASLPDGSNQASGGGTGGAGGGGGLPSGNAGGGGTSQDGVSVTGNGGTQTAGNGGAGSGGAPDGGSGGSAGAGGTTPEAGAGGGPTCPKPVGQICHEFYVVDNGRLIYVNEFTSSNPGSVVWAAPVGSGTMHSRIEIVDNATSKSGKAVLL